MIDVQLLQSFRVRDGELGGDCVQSPQSVSVLGLEAPPGGGRAVQIVARAHERAQVSGAKGLADAAQQVATEVHKSAHRSGELILRAAVRSSSDHIWRTHSGEEVSSESLVCGLLGAAPVLACQFTRMFYYRTEANVVCGLDDINI